MRAGHLADFVLLGRTQVAWHGDRRMAFKMVYTLLQMNALWPFYGILEFLLEIRWSAQFWHSGIFPGNLVGGGIFLRENAGMAAKSSLF